MYYYVYSDDGPSGAGGQTTFATRSWTILFISEREMSRKMLNRYTGKLRRKNKRITGRFSDDARDELDTNEETGHETIHRITADEFDELAKERGK